MVKKMAENPQASVPNQTPGKMEVVISATIGSSESYTEYIYLLKDDFDQFYLVTTVCGWKQVSEIQKNPDILLKHEYYVDKTVVPLIYFILSTDPTELGKVFEFLYKEGFLEYEEEK